uniref:ZP domain-containing protein n=1 Tax=Elaeophora elaphi TaxID=1147741 RepID=A0A0R3RFJ5_9BILA
LKNFGKCFSGLEEQAGVVTGTGGIPALQIQIRDGHGIAGTTVTHASVGQLLTLDIVLENTEIYDFYAHSCVAYDGSNNAEALVQIIDANGCGIALPRAIELPVFMTSPSNGSPKHIYIYMYGFQFTSSQFVYFECQARPCIHLNPNTTLSTSPGSTCPPLFFLIVLFTALGLMPTITIMVCYGIIVHRRQ